MERSHGSSSSTTAPAPCRLKPHSHTVATRQPCASRFSTLRLSLAALPASLVSQNAAFDFGVAAKPAFRVPVPETAVDKDHGAITPEYEIRAAKQLPDMEAIAIAAPVKFATEQKLRFRIPPTDSGHHPRAGLGIGEQGGTPHLTISTNSRALSRWRVMAAWFSGNGARRALTLAVQAYVFDGEITEFISRGPQSGPQVHRSFYVAPHFLERRQHRRRANVRNGSKAGSNRARAKSSRLLSRRSRRRASAFSVHDLPAYPAPLHQGCLRRGARF